MKKPKKTAPRLLDILSVEEASKVVEALKVWRAALVAQAASDFLSGKKAWGDITSEIRCDVDALIDKIQRLVER